MKDVLTLAKELQPQLVKWRRDLHAIPEIGLELPKTSQYVQECLKEMGIPYKTMVNGSGIVALIESGQPGKTVALRADMDALPIVEEAPVDFKSTNGFMHACGHDTHASMLLGAAKILNDHKDELKGNVKFIFQPGEESPGGAKPMIEEGCLENPKVDAIFGQHIGCLFPGMTSGKIMVSYNNAMACRDAFKILIKGRGAHSSTPNLSIDPIAVASQVINAIYMMKARELDVLYPSVISVCMIHGGTASNIIPDTIEMEGSTRSIDPEMRKLIAKRIEEVLKSTCATYGATYEFEYMWDYDVTVNDKDMAQLVIDTAKNLFPAEDVIIQSNALMGSEDMSFYLAKVPGAYYFLSSVVEQDGVVYGHHNPKFMLDESVFCQGTALLVELAASYLNS